MDDQGIKLDVRVASRPRCGGAFRLGAAGLGRKRRNYAVNQVCPPTSRYLAWQATHCRLTSANAPSARDSPPLTGASWATRANRLAAWCMAVPIAWVARGHQSRHVAGAVKLQGGHTKPLLGDVRRVVVLTGGEGGLDLGDGSEMVAHVRAHVRLHHRGHGHGFAHVVGTTVGNEERHGSKGQDQRSHRGPPKRQSTHTTDDRTNQREVELTARSSACTICLSAGTPRMCDGVFARGGRSTARRDEGSPSLTDCRRRCGA